MFIERVKPLSDAVVNTTETVISAEEANRNYVYENRRYVGRKEFIAYIMFDFAQNFTINKYNERFIFDVVRIDFNFQALVNFIGGIWDVVNDTFIGAIVDRTRTRWGKFKPYLVALAIPGTIGSLLYWLLPIFFPNTAENDLVKFITYFALAVTRETIETFRGISVTGMLATISPHPVERTRLITMAHLLSIGDNVPEVLMSLLIDGINNGILKNLSMKNLYVAMGCFTTLVSGSFAFYFSLVAKERIIQSQKGPSVLEGIKSILNNKPILLITLAEFLGSFSINTGMTNYYIDVLGSSSIYMIVGIPGGFVSTPSFAWVPWFRRHFSTKTLWLLGSSTGDFLMALVFLFGSIGGIKNGLYKRRLPMIIAIMIQETLFMFVYGIRKVIPKEMYNEAMDYCEWKNGYRTEGMTSVARGLATKLVHTVGATIRSFLMKQIGYVQGAGHLKQSDKTKYYLFAMSTVIPFVTGILGIIPKLFYDLDGEKRERMYMDLLQRRDEKVREASKDNGFTQIESGEV